MLAKDSIKYAVGMNSKRRKDKSEAKESYVPRRSLERATGVLIRLLEEPFEPAGYFEFYSISIRYRVSTNEAVCRFLNVLSEIGLSQLKVTDTKECSIFWNDPTRSLF